jgi:hypothetical protein
MTTRIVAQYSAQPAGSAILSVLAAVCATLIGETLGASPGS